MVFIRRPVTAYDLYDTEFETNRIAMCFVCNLGKHVSSVTFWNIGGVLIGHYKAFASLLTMYHYYDVQQLCLPYEYMYSVLFNISSTPTYLQFR